MMRKGGKREEMQLIHPFSIHNIRTKVARIEPAIYAISIHYSSCSIEFIMASYPFLSPLPYFPCKTLLQRSHTQPHTFPNPLNYMKSPLPNPPNGFGGPPPPNPPPPPGKPLPPPLMFLGPSPGPMGSYRAPGGTLYR